VGGFAYSDVERAGISVLAVADDGVAAAARQVVEETVADIERRAAAFIVRRPSVDEAVAEAVASQARPVVLADVADNIGGGTPGDGTALLAELLAQRVAGAVVSIVDPEVARRAAVLGPGGRIKTLVGGKTDRRHGEPVPVEGVVQRVTDGRYRAAGTWMTGRAFSMGTTALVDVDGLSLVVMERRLPPFHAEQLTSIGIDPAAASVIVAKGAVAWRSAWGDVARLIIEVDTPGVTPVDPWSLLRRTAPVRS
jgi:microcystin degradation protein MlrC